MYPFSVVSRRRVILVDVCGDNSHLLIQSFVFLEDTHNI